MSLVIPLVRRFVAINRRCALVATVSLGCTSLASQALPIYVDAPPGQNVIDLTVDSSVQKRAARIRRLTDYIQQTFNIPQYQTAAIVTEAVYNASKHDLRLELILAIIAVESTFRAQAVSPTGARGLMQIMPEAHPERVEAIGGIKALFDTKKNIATGSAIFIEYLRQSSGNLQKALLRYNGSLTNPDSEYPDKVLELYKKLKKIAQTG